MDERSDAGFEISGKFHRRGLKAKVREAYRFACHILGIRPGLHVAIHAKPDLGSESGRAVRGECYALLDSHGRATGYAIDLLVTRDATCDAVLRDLFHETAHLAQQVRGDLVLHESGYGWLGRHHESVAVDAAYPHVPWEAEAVMIEAMLAASWDALEPGCDRPWLKHHDDA